MRIRSCQLVYLLLLLCSVQGLDARALGGVAATDLVGTMAASREAASAEAGVSLPRVAAQADTQLGEPGMCLYGALPFGWAGPAGHARAVATYTSFERA